MYDGEARVDAIGVKGDQVVVAYYNPANGRSYGTYWSPDGQNLGGGGASQLVDSGRRTPAIARYGSEVLVATEACGIWRSPDGHLFGHPGVSRVYP